MTVNCPCCRASNTTATCRRCKADLGLLLAAEARREYCLTSARRFAADGRASEALPYVLEAGALRAGDDARRLHAVLLLLQRDFDGAMRTLPLPPAGGRSQ